MRCISSLLRLFAAAGMLGSLFPGYGITVDDFLNRSFMNSGNQRMPYRLYVPRDLDSSKSYPLVVFFHGYGNENGTNNRNQVTQWPGCMTFATYQSQVRYPCFVLIPQHNVNEYWVQQETSARAVEIIDSLLTEFPEIDSRKVYGVGLSDGGHAIFDFQRWFPDVFAAGATLGGHALQEDAIDFVARWPIWMAFGEQEDATVIQESKQLFQEMEAAGGVSRLTLYPSAGHLIFNPGFFDEPDLAGWLFQFESGTKILASPTNLHASSIGNGSVTLNWDAPVSGESEPVAYEIFRDDVSIGRLTRQTYESAPELSFTDNVASASSTYRYEVVAVSNTSDISAPTELVVTVPNDTKPPVIVQIGGGSTEVAVRFDEPVDELSATNPQNYQLSPGVQIANATLQEDLRTVTLVTTGLEIGRDYSISVSAVSDRAAAKNTLSRVETSFVNLPSEGQLLWLTGEADDLGVSDTSRVYQWRNQAFSTEYSAQQRVSRNGPREVTWEGDSTSVAEFDGDGAHLRLEEGMADFSQGLSCLSVVNPRRRAQDLLFQFAIGAGIGSGTPGLLEAISFGRDNLQRLYFETCFGTSALRITSPEPVEENRPQIMGVIGGARTGIQSNAEIFVDGDRVASGVVYSPKNIIRTNNYIGRGNRTNVDSIAGFLRAQVAEVVLYNRALSIQERVGIEGYLYRKWLSDGMTNRAPVVELEPIAGQSFDSGQSHLTVALSAAVADDDLPTSALEYAWSVKVAPAHVEIASPASRVTTARIVSPGDYTFEFFADDGELRTSKEVTVTIGGIDIVAPEIIFAEANGNNKKVTLTYSEDVEAASANNVANYSVDLGVEVMSAELLGDNRTVLLTVTPMEEGITYTLRSAGVRDLSESGNESDSSRQFTYSRTYLSENFNGDFDGWIPVDEGTVEPFSIWKIINGSIRESSNINDNSDSNDGRLGTFLLWGDELAKQWTSYLLEADLRSLDDDGIGLMVYYQDPDNYYRFEMDAQRGFRKLIRKKGGVVTLLASESQGYTTGQSYRVAVDVTDEGIRVRLDGATLFDGRINDTALIQGSVALFAWGNSGAYFDNLSVTFNERTVLANDLTEFGLSETIFGTGVGSAQMLSDGSIRLNVVASGFATGSGAASNLYLQEIGFAGEFDVRAEVKKPLKSGAMVGLLARETTDEGAMLGVTFRSDGSVVLSRSDSGGAVSEEQVAQINGEAIVVRLRRSGEMIKAYFATDGVAWNEVGHITVDHLSPVAVGIVAASNDSQESATVELDFFSASESENGTFFEKDEYIEEPLPDFETDRDTLPSPILDENPEWVTLYWKTWELAYQHYRKPSAGSQLVSNFMDEAFDTNTLFQWDTTFLTMFGRYNDRNFPAIESLDNFYHAQRSNGFIARSFDETSGTSSVEGPDSVNPPLFAWAEWESFQITGSMARFSRVALPLIKYGEWLESNRAKAGTAHGLFYNTPLGSGMDNTPRTGSGWIDMSAQMVLHYHYLAKILEAIGQQSKAADHSQKADELAERINHWMWDDIDGQYYDVYDEGAFAIRKTIASFWPLLAGVADRDRAVEMVGHLRDTATFNRLVPFPSLAADDPLYHELGDYWRGGVWAPTTYAVIKGLEEIEFSQMASESSAKYLEALSGVYQATGTLWENYAPDSHARGNRSFQDFVGWTGLGPISLLLENVIGLRPDAPENTLVWEIRRTDRHGVEHYPLGSNDISLVAAARASAADAVSISVENSEPFDLRLKAADREITFHLAAGSHTLSTDDGLLQPPSGLQATRTGVTSVSLSWTDENAVETGYRVYRRAASDPDWDETAWQVAGEVPANTTAFVDALPQTQDSAYRYIVRAFNTDELSAASAEANITTLAPIPSLDVSPGGTVDIHENITFDASGSVDTGGSIETWEWDFGDGHVRTNGSIVVHAFELPGRYRVRLTVTSSSGLKRKISHVVKVQDRSNLKDALLVVGSTTLNPAERELKHQLERRGYFVEVATGAAATPASASGMDLILISSSVASTDVNTKFRDVPVPVLVYESLLFDDMGMTGLATSEYGNQSNQTKVSILNASHPLAGGLSEGSLTVYIQAAFVSWGRPNENAISIASVEGDASRKVIFGYEEGSQMVGMVAPERRLGFFFENDGVGLLTEEGSALLDAALGWLVNKKPTIRITAPLAGEDFVSDDEIIFSAEASDADGTISRVEFFNGAESLGFSSTPPYTTTATGFLPGTHSITAIATDNRGGSRVSKPVSIHVVPGSALDLWRQKHFLAEELADPDLSGDRADPDGDQINNLLEFAFDLDPRGWNAVAQTLGQIEVDGEIYMTITYTRPKNAAGIEYKVGVSDDLKTWYSGPTATVETSRVDHGKTWTITVRDLVPTTTVNRRFIRMSVESALNEMSYREDFDSLPASSPGFDSAWSSNLTLPLWYANRSQIRVTNGSGGSLDSAGFARLTSFGMDNSSERALGTTHHLFAGDATVFGIRFINDTGRTLTHFSIAFDGEQWRRASVATASDQTLTCEYAINPTGLTSGAYIPLPGITFHSIDNGGGGAGGAGLNGNAVALRRMSATVTGVEWPPGESLWIRWVDIDDPGVNDHGLGIDNFEFRTGADGETAISDSSGMLTFP